MDMPPPSIKKRKRKNELFTKWHPSLLTGHWNTTYRSKHTKTIPFTHIHTHTLGSNKGDHRAEGDSAAQAVRHVSLWAPWCVLVCWAMGTGAYFTEGDIPGIPDCHGRWVDERERGGGRKGGGKRLRAHRESQYEWTSPTAPKTAASGWVKAWEDSRRLGVSLILCFFKFCLPSLWCINIKYSLFTLIVFIALFDVSFRMESKHKVTFWL